MQYAIAAVPLIEALRPDMASNKPLLAMRRGGDGANVIGSPASFAAGLKCPGMVDRVHNCDSRISSTSRNGSGYKNN